MINFESLCRLGKRERTGSASRLEHLLCPSGSQMCLREIRQTIDLDSSNLANYGNNNAFAGALARMLALASQAKSRESGSLFEPSLDNVYVTENSNEQLPASLYQSNPLAMDQEMAQICREARESSDTTLPIGCGHLDMKRVAFTPRIGRR